MIIIGESTGPLMVGIVRLSVMSRTAWAIDTALLIGRARRLAEAYMSLSPAQVQPYGFLRERWMTHHHFWQPSLLESLLSSSFWKTNTCRIYIVHIGTFLAESRAASGKWLGTAISNLKVQWGAEYADCDKCCECECPVHAGSCPRSLCALEGHKCPYEPFLSQNPVCAPGQYWQPTLSACCDRNSQVRQ